MNLKEQAVLIGLQQLFDPTRWFDICRVQALGKLVGVSLTPQQDALFGVLHCVHYSTMPEGMREALALEVVQLLQQGLPRLDFSVNKPKAQATEAEVQVVPKAVGFLQRFLS